ncbi:uncharacterized protein PADG_11475 [Paracoccidioides brasiliensis Pb18]|uniref:Uncharacterized protein n=1 Tax=Paracoccidioides brasiliensis (strain Pb18) TaxID=502780 RepID=A0A0A0HUM2_PARBD|nr:uncharacterized protein PADG_11475 [Paracoccidioides brasiliensis Pb18]KGM92287.1 hypothetical protein PADG_11475 [Paracoccidioides brasiliensis Pb18]
MSTRMGQDQFPDICTPRPGGYPLQTRHYPSEHECPALSIRWEESITHRQLPRLVLHGNSSNWDNISDDGIFLLAIRNLESRTMTIQKPLIIIHKTEEAKR